MQVIDLGVNIPVGIFTVNGQIWTGKNLYDFQGGLGNWGTGADAVKASGGFANLKIKPWDYLYFNTAYGIDNPENDKLAVGAKSKNSNIMGNINYVLVKKVTITFEMSYMVTEYKTATGFDERGNQHYQLSFSYPF